MNDETTLRIYGSKSDAYAAFKGMFDKGDPPDDSFALLQAASADLAAKGRDRTIKGQNRTDAAHYDALQRMADLDQESKLFNDYATLNPPLSWDAHLSRSKALTMNPRSEPDTPDNAADQMAVETVTVPERTALQPADHEAFFAVLDRPPVPTEKLREALARHRKTTINR